jgi:hypothetical protein
VAISQKAFLSLVISIFFFALFAVISFVGFFDFVETRFYNPAIIKNISKELEQETQVIQDFIKKLDDDFSAILENEAVKRSFLPNQSEEDVSERSKLFETLMESLNGLQSVQFIDVAGKRIHFSTFQSDFWKQDELSILHRDISVLNQEHANLIFDLQQDRILFLFPFYDSSNILRGTAVFHLSVHAISDELLRKRLIPYGENLSVVSDLSNGIVMGVPYSFDENLFLNAVNTVWNQDITSLTPLDSENGELSFALFSAKTDQGFFVGKVADESLFIFPFAMKIILLASFFFTIYLIVFLLFNIRQDSVTLIQNRLKRLQINLFEEYYEQKGNIDWARWSTELEQRREEVRNEIKQGIKIKPNSDNALKIDALIDASWSETIAVMSAQSQPHTIANLDEDSISLIVNRVLAAAGNLSALTENTSKLHNEELSAESEEEKMDEADEMFGELEELDDGENPTDEFTVNLEKGESIAELEAFDEAEELIPLIDSEDIDETLPADTAPSMSADEISRLASEIEFSDTNDQEEDFDLAVEIFSPFAAHSLNTEKSEKKK